MPPSHADFADSPPIPVRDGPETVFLVDDDPQVLRAMEALLRRAGYEVRAFEDAGAALAEVDADAPDVLVTDYNMPSMTGLELAERVLEERASAKIVLVTGAGDESTAQAALRAGVFDYLTKPFEVDELVQVVLGAFMAHAREEYAHATESWLRGEVERQTGLIRAMTVGTLKALMKAQEARTPHFRGHSQAVAKCAAAVARELGLPRDEISSIQTAGLLHDLGMIAVPDSVVNKPGSLSEEEFAAVRTHPRQGARILSHMEHLGPVGRYIEEHHERLDGSGYPDRKVGDEISLGGQIVGLSESWTALTEERSYRGRQSRAEAVEILAGAEGSWFSAELVRALRSSRARGDDSH